MKGHVDAGTLAAYREGLLARRRAARVSAHLAGCPRCAETGEQLANITATLAASPAPPMPAGLAARIGAALAAEVASRVTGGAAHAEPAGHTEPAGDAEPAGAARRPAPAGHSGHRRPPIRSRVALRVAAVTAAVAVLAGGVYGLVLLSQGGTTATSGSSLAEGTAGRMMRPGKVHAHAPAAAGPHKEPSVGHVISSGTRYQPRRLAAQAREVLARHPDAGIPAMGLPSAGSRSLSLDFGSLASCVRRVSGGQRPRLVDLATYAGRPAAVIMIPAGTSVRVVVVGTGCSAARSDVIARTTLPGAG